MVTITQNLPEGSFPANKKYLNDILLISYQLETLNPEYFEMGIVKVA